MNMNRFIGNWILGCLLLMVTAINVEAQEPVQVTVRGKLVDEQGTPYAFNPVTLTTPDGQTLETQTDYQGVFQLAGPLSANQASLTLYTTYGRAPIADLPLIWPAGDTHPTLDLGTAPVSLVQKRFLVITADGNEAESGASPTPGGNPTTATTPPSQVNPPPTLLDLSSTLTATPILPPGTSPAGTAAAALPTPIDRTRGWVVLVILVGLGAGLVAGGVVLARRGTG